MTDEELDSFEVAAKKMIETSCGPFASFYNEDFSKVILDLIASLRQTRKERDWLAEKLESNTFCCLPDNEECGCSFCSECEYGTYEGWLNAAKEAAASHTDASMPEQKQKQTRRSYAHI